MLSPQIFTAFLIPFSVFPPSHQLDYPPPDFQRHLQVQLCNLRSYRCPPIYQFDIYFNRSRAEIVNKSGYGAGVTSLLDSEGKVIVTK